MPARRYSAYLVRHWSLPGGRERIEIQHIQSGEIARVPSFQAALDWLGQQERHAPDGQTAPDPAGLDGKEVPESEP